jgi:hypothetical protein
VDGKPLVSVSDSSQTCIDGHQLRRLVCSSCAALAPCSARECSPRLMRRTRVAFTRAGCARSVLKGTWTIAHQQLIVKS